MPQLNPNPWFPIFLFTWLFFLIIMPNKVMSHLLNNNIAENTQKPQPTPWNWPWS
nr:ATP synthase F0 subunit 8 [Paratrygon ajereba]QZL30609.1 ATP synthase F0 subunit 8 [Paratrygon ajereba]QZL30612.1 ATP synthase F0 subunit 8 [Paratrygon ajereba]QZL30615.1 ATP synthase F0 subunit 8 [Paratrygon ajereba]QZL30618.1 ATP synthase F0 subunit 8 [Paratrygon ajereba]